MSVDVYSRTVGWTFLSRYVKFLPSLTPVVKCKMLGEVKCSFLYLWVSGFPCPDYGREDLQSILLRSVGDVGFMSVGVNGKILLPLSTLSSQKGTVDRNRQRFSE